ncbi:unnamed protein product [Brachionus calyciflorus]|uniref:DNA primase large subunit n=1 Tax=Brachionus calyciflorus TaxID=104777 RepID=A0A813Q1V2_9BILA|nr:unnamed protein product [Brachionus calyciflorus]
MIIGGGRKQESVSRNIKREVVSPLLMYNSPPDGRLEFDEFASVAIERFSILQMFETIGARYMKGGNDYLSKLDTELRKLGFLKTILCSSKDTPIDEAELNKDIVSHFILRLAFCQTEELKRWFIQQECDLFRYKLNRIQNDQAIIEKFLQDNDLLYVPITDSEKDGIMDSLIEMGGSPNVIKNTHYFKINFLEVLDLVKTRRVLVKKGFAYVTIADFGSVLTHVFRTRLSKSLATLSRHIKEIEEDQRISDLLKILRERDIGENYSDTTARDHLTAESLDSHSIKSFPMCMRNLHEALKSNHHLRHYGRLQYLLFLKGIGLPLEESLKFWRNEFSKGSISVDKFEKEYAYNIRHSYGKEGKRTSYTPYSCLKIITSHMPGNNDYHGCPFKHFEREFLKQKLKQYGRSQDETNQIMDHADSNNYQIACQRYFEFAHKTEEIVPINHPNQYFEQSMRLINGNNRPGRQNPNQSIKMEHIKIEMTQ